MFTAVASEESGKRKEASADRKSSKSALSYETFINNQREATAAYAQAQTRAIHIKPNPTLLL